MNVDSDDFNEIVTTILQMSEKDREVRLFMKKNISFEIEKKLGRYAISNISLYLIICYAFGYLITFVNSGFLSYLTLNPYLILHGQIWRLFTWIIVPPSSSNIIFTLIMLYFYYSIGTTLENTWGTYRYNVYLFSGMLYTVIGSFLLYGICVLAGAQMMPVGSETVFVFQNGLMAYFGMFSTYYINMSIFLAFAATFPDNQVLLMMIIPIKVKWLGIVYGLMILYDCVQGGMVTWFVVGASLLNFAIFFITTNRKLHMSPKQIKRRHVYQKQVNSATGVTKHKCAICGRTEKDGADLEFRFCSKCDGNYEYCKEHLFTHEHIRRM